MDHKQWQSAGETLRTLSESIFAQGQDPTQSLQNRLVRGMLRSVTMVATVGIAYFCYHAYTDGSFWVIPIYLAAYVVLLLATFWRRLSYSARAGTVVLLIYGLGVLDLVESGRGGDGRIFLLSMPLVATLLSRKGQRGGIVALVVSVITVAVFGWLYVNGYLVLPPGKVISHANPSAWVSNSLVLLMLGVLLTFSMGFVMSHFGSTLAQSADLVKELQIRDEALRGRAEELEAANALLRGRAEALNVTAGVAREAASVLNLQEMLTRVASMVSERFGFYHAGIFLVDPTGEWAELRAASSQGGQRMLARHHRLRVGQEGIVGYVTSRGASRVATNVGVDTVYFDNPDLPDTRSEMAVPLLYQGRVIGALDVQSVQADAFGDDDVTVFQTLADLIVVAIRNARLFGQVQESLAAERRSYGEVSAQAWVERVRRAPTLGYRFDAQRGDVVQLDPRPSAGSAETNELTLPVRVRGRTIGEIRAHKPGERETWTSAEVELMETLAQQLDMALESARLYEDAQDRATRDRLVSNVSARVRETLDMEAVLKTAADEIYRALDLEEVVVRLAPEAPEDDSAQEERTC
jgi:GAF domain-containing protein